MVNLSNLYIIAIGIYFVVFSKWIAKKASSENLRLLGIKYNERIYQISFTLIGTFFVGYGICEMLGIIHFSGK